MEELTIPTLKEARYINSLFKKNKFYNLNKDIEKTTDLAVIKGAGITIIWENGNCYSTYLSMLTQTYVDNEHVYNYLYTACDTQNLSIVDTRGIIFPILKNPKGIKFDMVANEIEYGEYPQNIPKISTRKKLKDLYKKNKLKATNETYDLRLNFRTYELETCKVYEYMGKKFILSTCLDRPDDAFISSKNIYSDLYGKYDNYIWLEVKKIKWIVDKDNHRLISKRGILSGIPIGECDSFEKSFMYEYLNTHVLKDMFQNELGQKENINDKQDDSQYHNAIKEQIDSLYELTDKNNDTDVMKKKVNEILDSYNEKIELLNYGDTLALDTFDSIYSETISKINNLRVDYEIYLNVNKTSIEIYSILNSITSILNNEEYEGNNELCLFMINVNKILDDNNRNKLLNIINNYKEELNKIKQNNKLSLNYPKYSSLNVFERDFREKLSIILNNIKNESIEKERVLLKNLIFGKYKENLENNYRNMINELIEQNLITTKSATEEELESINSIIKEYKSCEELSMEKALDIYSKLDKIYSDIISRINFNKQKKYYIYKKIVL